MPSLSMHLQQGSGRAAVFIARLMVCAASLLAEPALAQETPDAFATRLPIRSDAATPYYRLSVPLLAYIGSAHGDLRDLRVFNAAGQPVPYARLAASGSTEDSVQRQSLRWFPLRAAASGRPASQGSDKSLSVVVRQAGDGTLVEIDSRRAASGNTAATPDEAPLRGYLLDASQIANRQAARALELDWGQSASDFLLVDLESSDDLQHWQSLASGVQLARLEYNGARIDKRRIDLTGFRDRYLRLVWREPATAPKLNKAELEQSSSRYLAAPLAWSSPMSAVAGDADLKPGEFRYRLAQPLPIARLRIELPPGNQLLPLEVLVPGRDRRYWRSLASTVVYRITSNGREWSNDEISLAQWPIREFVLRLDPRLNPLPQGPRVAFALQPAQIIFLARGEGPYLLAVGNKEAKDAALAPATLVPGFGTSGSPDIADASVAKDATESSLPSATPAASNTTAHQTSWKKFALWGVLVLSVFGMAAMAWQLLRQLKKPGEGH